MPQGVVRQFVTFTLLPRGLSSPGFCRNLPFFKGGRPVNRGNRLGSATVLIIEDDATFRQTLARFLLKHELTVVETGQYQNVTRLADEHHPRFIVLDLNLGEGYGLNLIAPLKQALPESRIVVLTGCGSLQVAVSAIKLGASDYLVKPVEGESILASLFGTGQNVGPLPMSPRMPLDDLEWAHISKTLADNGGNISQTAELLKMNRRTLQRKLSKYQPASRGRK